MAGSSFQQTCLDLQGFGGLSDADKARLSVPLRFTPALCLLLTLVGVALRSPLLLGALTAAAAVAALGHPHPFDLLYTAVLRPLAGGPHLPANPPPRRFAFVLAVPVLGATTVAFAVGAAGVGIGLGALQLAGCATYVATGWCPGSFAHGKLFGARAGRPDRGLGLHHG